MVAQELRTMKGILDLILGESKQELDDSLQLQYPCPRCIEKYGISEARKFNCELNLGKQAFHCWKCSSEGDDMQGSVKKLIRRYGNSDLLSQYLRTLSSFRSSELYKLHYAKDMDQFIKKQDEIEEIKLPKTFKEIRDLASCPTLVSSYLRNRGIGMDIILKHHIGYTIKEEENSKSSYRIIIPSYDDVGELNYWVGRDYLPKSHRIKYDNPKVPKTEMIFNESLVQWDGDVTLVEGPFDHIVVPNSIPLLGKALNESFKLYWDILEKSNSLINIWLDGDAYESVLDIYRLLNHGKLYGKIRYIPTENDDDPSSIYEKFGKNGIISHLSMAKKIDEIYL